MADIIETAFRAGSLVTFLTSLRAAGMTDILHEAGPFTLFAPSDDAFEKLPLGMLENIIDSPELLREVLHYHIVPGRLTTEMIQDEQTVIVKSLQGEPIVIDLTVFGRTYVNEARIIRADLIADNGVVHVIDTVIMPETLRGRRAA